MEFIKLESIINDLPEFQSMYLAMDTDVETNGTLKDDEKKLGPVVLVKKESDNALFLSCDTTHSPPYVLHRVPIKKAYVFSTGKPHTKQYGQSGGKTRKGKRSAKKTMRRRR